MLHLQKNKLALLVCITGALCFSASLYAQEKDQSQTNQPLAPVTQPALTTETALQQVPDEDDIHTSAEEAPEPGFDMNEYLHTNVVYPEQELREGIQGRVIVQLVIMKTGEIRNAKVARSLTPALDAEALRVVNAMPAWKRPARQGGKPINVYYTLPISYRIRD
ncbi:energy transducer TonB [Taibaiella chishuiensis]|uniref:TonB family protein n=1 Tax=Taibaiella chishuiensis TaxID=1434707 RepID=A0A2P8DAC3_9BACT|nr:energy transducer TonB [Taibaiella chishuiensis]PSK94153.1 TonB family protein [Taibaiella chishuiensis]